MGNGGTVSGVCNVGVSGGELFSQPNRFAPRDSAATTHWIESWGSGSSGTDPAVNGQIPWRAGNLPFLDRPSHNYFFFYHGARVLVALSRILDHRHTTVGRTPLDEWWARHRDLYQDNTQHSQETNIHVPSGIRTHNPMKRVAADPRLKPRGQYDQPIITCYTKLTNRMNTLLSQLRYFILGNPI